MFSVLLSLFRLFRSSFVPLLSSSNFFVRILFLLSVLLFARHVIDGGVFRSIGNFSIIPASTPNRKRKIEKDKGRRLGGLASLGSLVAPLIERSFHANFSYGYEKFEKNKRAQRRI